MDNDIKRFIKHTIVNLEGTLMKDDDQLTLAVLTNLSDVLDSYIAALEQRLPDIQDYIERTELSAPYATMAGQE